MWLKPWRVTSSAGQCGGTHVDEDSKKAAIALLPDVTAEGGVGRWLDGKTGRYMALVCLTSGLTAQNFEYLPIV